MIGDKALLLSPNACDDMTAEGCALTGSHPMISCWLVDGGQVLSGNSLGISARLQLGPTLSDAVDDVIIDESSMLAVSTARSSSTCGILIDAQLTLSATIMLCSHPAF